MINLKQWIEASTEQRGTWLKESYELDNYSRNILCWAESFKEFGATIPDSAMLRLYESGQQNTD